jgi:uncharacterized integral membrane protein (TIGR00698 family)
VALLPGLAVVAVGVALALAVHHVVPVLSALVVATVLGAVATNVGAVPDAARAGLGFASRQLLRAGIVLLGLRLPLGEVAALGLDGVVAVVAVVAVTFVGVRWLGRRLAVPRGLSLLTATGFAICGASAIAAVRPLSGADDEEAAFSIALVTLFGTLAIVALPLLQGPLGLDGAAFGAWVGASVHDVGQVVATASAGPPEAVGPAVVVKLTRVAMLAPLVAGVGLAARRQAGAGAGAQPGAGGQARRPALVPPFVVGFLVAVAVRNLGLLPGSWLEVAAGLETVVLAGAMVGLGSGVHLARLRRLGARPLLLGALGWVLVATAGYVAVTATAG